MMNSGVEDRGLLYEPEYEEEVVMLFSLLIPYLEDSFVIDRYQDSFPDCFAVRNGQRIGIEFEVLSSNFYEHRHHEDLDNLEKCDLIVCWRNDKPQKTVTRDEKKFLKVAENRYVEVMSLDEVVERLEKEKSLRFILKGRRPDLEKASEERFFTQLRENVNEQKYNWIKSLYELVKQQKEFEIRWSQGKHWFTMRFYVKKWNVDPLNIQGNGLIWVNYEGNPAISQWELPREVQEKLRRIFKHEKQKWPTAPLEKQEDFDKIKNAIETLAKESGELEIIWRKQQNDF
jgi:hypothetical protein